MLPILMALWLIELPILHCDSQSAIMLAWNLVFHAKMKHTHVKCHVIIDELCNKSIKLVKVHTYDNRTSLLAKSLPQEQFAHS